MTIDQVKEEIMAEIKQFRIEVAQSLLAVNQRLDQQDLNHAAEYLRSFGYFLERNPSFMERMRLEEDLLKEKEIARQYITRVLHLGNIKVKLSWLGAGVAAGFLFALGNALFLPFGSFSEEFKNIFLSALHMR